MVARTVVRPWEKSLSSWAMDSIGTGVGEIGTAGPGEAAAANMGPSIGSAASAMNAHDANLGGRRRARAAWVVDSISGSARSPGLHELLLAARGYGVVMTQLHGIGALTAGEGFQP